MHNVVVFGASEHAKVVLDLIEKAAEFSVVGLIDSFKPAGKTWFGYTILGSETDLPGLVATHDIVGGLVAVGDNWVRYRLVERIRAVISTFEFITAVHPSATLARGVEIGCGTVIMAGVTINSDSRIGDFCIINTSASIDHDNSIGDYASLAPGVVTGGKVTVERFSAVSLGAKIIHGCTIGPHTVIGAGATVLQDIAGYSVAWGTPARVIGQRNEADRYL